MPESPQSHICEALQLLRFARPADAESRELIRAAEGRCWRAVNALREPAERPAWWFRVRRIVRRQSWGRGATRALAAVLALLLAGCVAPTAPADRCPSVPGLVIHYDTTVVGVDTILTPRDTVIYPVTFCHCRIVTDSLGRTAGFCSSLIPGGVP